MKPSHSTLPEFDAGAHIAFSGEMILLRWGESSNAGRTVSFQLDNDSIEHPFKRFDVGATKTKTAGKRFMAVLVEIDDQELPVSQGGEARHSSHEDRQRKSFGRQSSILYRTGWFFRHNVHSAIGTRDQFFKACEDGGCNLCGAISTDDNLVEMMPLDSSGVAFAGIPVCDHCELDAMNLTRAEFERRYGRLMSEWASHALAQQLGYSSIGNVPPSELVAWARIHNVDSTLPQSYLLKP